MVSNQGSTTQLPSVHRGPIAHSCGTGQAWKRAKSTERYVCLWPRRPSRIKIVGALPKYISSARRGNYLEVVSPVGSTLIPCIIPPAIIKLDELPVIIGGTNSRSLILFFGAEIGLFNRNDLGLIKIPPQ